MNSNFILIRIFILTFFIAGIQYNTSAQARLILNGATVHLNNGATLVVDNGAANAITRTSGQIISEGENNIIRWNIGTTTGTYTLPWGVGSSSYIPFTFTKGPGTGNGFFLFSTYATNWDNVNYIPSAVSNFNETSGADKSAFSADRFWQINAQGYSTKPNLSALTFTYQSTEFQSPNNTAVQNSLTTQRWNSDLSTWNDFAPVANTASNTVSLATLNAADLYAWWALSYVLDRHWVAATSGQWSTRANWSNTAGGTGGASVPTALNAVILDAGGNGNMTLDNAVSIASLSATPGYTGTIMQGSKTLTVEKDATLSGGVFSGGSADILVKGSLNLTGNSFTSTTGVLDIKGNYTYSGGSFTHHSGTVKFSGTETQLIAGTSVTDFNNVVIDNLVGVSVETDQNLQGIVRLTTNALFDSDGTEDNATFTLISSQDAPTKDASIDQLPSGAEITGEVTIQRYMAIEGASGGRIYRYISSPVQNARVVDIQNEIPITGPFSGTSVCSGCLQNASMFAYDETVITDTNNDKKNDKEDGYVGFPSRSNKEALTTAAGYALYVRGNILPTARWDAKGYINAANNAPVSFPVTHTSSGKEANDGWNLVGNPFPSTIDWNAASGWSKTNIDGAIYMTDNGVTPTRSATWNGVVGTNGGSRYIAIGQGFWVKANASSPALTATESVKSAGTQTTFFRDAPLTNIVRITMRTTKAQDEAVIHFRKDAKDVFDKHADALKLAGGGFTVFTVLDDNTQLAINSRASLQCSTTVRLGVDATAGKYTLDFSQFESFANTVTLTLTDNFTKTTFNVRLGSYAFTVTADVTSKGTGRFSLAFELPKPSPDFLLSSHDTCEGNDATVTINPSQNGMAYFTYINGTATGDTFTGDGKLQNINIIGANLQTGNNTISIYAGMPTCSSAVQKDVVINVLKNPSIARVENGSICHAGIITLQASSVDGTSYNWYDAPEATTPIADQHTDTYTTPVLQQSKTYYVSARNVLACESSRSLVVAEVIKLENALITPAGDSLQSNYNSGNQWSFNGETIAGATNTFINATQTGTYSVTVSSQGCTTTADYAFIVTATEQPAGAMINAYPNPVHDVVNVILPNNYKDLHELRILNATGVVVGSLPLTAVDNVVTGHYTMAGLPAGVYILLSPGNNNAIHIKLIKQ